MQSSVGCAVVSMETQSSDRMSVYGRDEGSESIKYIKETLRTVRRTGVKRRPGERERQRFNDGDDDAKVTR